MSEEILTFGDIEIERKPHFFEECRYKHINI